MYELFVLGELLDGPAHGYILHRIVQEAIGPIRQMSWGALYPLLKRLEHEGLIEREPGAGGGGRERKLYRITATGETRFRALMAKPGAYDADYPDLLSLKLSNFHHIAVREQVAILRHYRGFVQFSQDYLQSHRDDVSVEPQIDDRERPYVLSSIDRRLLLAQTELQWLDTEIARRSGEPTSQ